MLDFISLFLCLVPSSSIVSQHLFIDDSLVHVMACQANFSCSAIGSSFLICHDIFLSWHHQFLHHTNHHKYLIFFLMISLISLAILRFPVMKIKALMFDLLFSYRYCCLYFLNDWFVFLFPISSLECAAGLCLIIIFLTG